MPSPAPSPFPISPKRFSPLSHPGPPSKRIKSYHNTPPHHPLTTCAPNLNTPAFLESMIANPADRSLLRGSFDNARSFGDLVKNSTSTSSATEPDEYIHEPESSSSLSSYSRQPIQMFLSFGPDTLPLSFSDAYDPPCDKGIAPRPDMPTCGTGFPEFLFDNMEFPQDLLLPPSCLEGVDPLSLEYFNPDISQQYSSPSSRSMSRSSFGSNSFAFSPYPEDFPTPASDTTAVTTPAPSDACFGSLSEQGLLGVDFSLSMEAKKADHPFAYVPGSAPHSPFNVLFDLSQATPFPPASHAASSSASVRRHSEPANIAACHFPSFFGPGHEAIPPPAPADLMTHSITDYLPLSGPDSDSTGLSSIAPHQMQLPRPVEMQHPRPVRAFKPQILLSGRHYDPKDFIRRRSEPILPLPELDHILDPLPEDDEDDDNDSMECEDAEEDVHEDGQHADDYVGGDGSPADLQFDGTLLNPDWSWLQPLSAGPQLDLLAGFGFGAVSPTTVLPSMNFGTMNWNA